jgi:hypothetical protein
MSNQLHPANPAPNGGYERTDISTRGVLYFLAGLAVFGALAYLAAAGVYSCLDKRSAAEQAPVNPLVTNAPADTRHISKDYPQQAFPNPRLETDERTQLDGDRLKEEQRLSTYDYIDKNAGAVRIPIDRAMDLITQRGLPVRAQASAAATPAPESKQPEKKKAKK